MSKIRKIIEQWFESFSLFLCRYRWWTLVIMLGLVGGLGSQLPQITFDTSNESFLHHTDPTLVAYNEFRHQFGRDDLIIIAIEPENIFDQKFLKKLVDFHEDLQDQVPYVEDITSMVNARNTRGEGDVLIVEDLLEHWPGDQAALKSLRERVMSNPQYMNRLISEDGRVTTLVIQANTFSSKGDSIESLANFDGGGGPAAGGDIVDVMEGFKEETTSVDEAQFLTDAELSAAVAQVKKVVAKYQAPDFKLYIAGAPVVTDTLKRFMIKDQKLFMRLIILTIGLCLFFMFRRLTAVVLPMIVVGSALVSTLGLMAIFKVPLKMPTAVLPSFIMAVGVADSIHILTIFYRQLTRTGKKIESIAYAMGHSALAIVLTTLTTAAGLASFSTSKVAPIAELGIFAGIGVLLALLFTLVMLPALLSVVPVKAKQWKTRTMRVSYMDELLIWISNFSTSYPKSITAVCTILVILSIFGAFQLTFTHHVLKWLPETADVRIATEKIDTTLKGSVVMEVVVDTGRVNGLFDIDILNNLESLAREIEKIKQEDLFVGKATSVADILKEIHRALNENRPEYYVIPQDPALIPQEFLLFENSGSDDLEDVVDSQFQTARFTIKVPWLDAVKYVALLEDLGDRFGRSFGDKAQVTMTGMMTILFSTVVSAIYSAAESYTIAGVVITVMVILLIGSIRIGLLAMLPNLLAISIVMGLMAVFNFPFDLFTMLIGSIAIGLAVDNTIHFMHNFRRYFAEAGDVPRAVRETLLTTGRALFVTTVVLSLGFFIYMFATMNNLFYFGLLTGLTIILALVANFFLAPALMALIHRPTHLA
ncbi:MAG: MMPL family transporter [Deltaproteobacteria bacterium]|nr:MMPL family transporter [Deltaproteobacteria bacterium]MBW2614112.1 MMPL family transporter [Deltaproteobacteria bacterium]